MSAQLTMVNPLAVAVAEASHCNRAAIVLYQVDPIQAARLDTLARDGGVDVRAVEVVGSSRHYEWQCAVEPSAFSLVRLFDEPPGEALEDKAVVEALETIAPDVVFVLGYARRFARATLRYALQRDVPAILVSDTTPFETSRNPVAALIKRILAGAFSAAFVAGTPQTRYVEGLGITADKIFTGYDVVDNAAIAAAARKARADPQAFDHFAVRPPYLLCVSRLVGQKNLRALIEAMALYRTRTQNPLPLAIVGYGPERDALDALITKSQLGDLVILAGGVPYDQMAVAYAGAVGLVLPSTSEPWGLVVNEALAAGLPVAVSCAVGAAEDLVQPGRNGVIFDPDDREAIADALVALTVPDDTRQAMGRESEAIVAEWSLERYRAGAEAAIAAALAPGARPPWPARFAALQVERVLQRRPDRVRGFR